MKEEKTYTIAKRIAPHLALRLLQILREKGADMNKVYIYGASEDNLYTILAETSFQIYSDSADTLMKEYLTR